MCPGCLLEQCISGLLGFPPGMPGPRCSLARTCSLVIPTICAALVRDQRRADPAGREQGWVSRARWMRWLDRSGLRVGFVAVTRALLVVVPACHAELLASCPLWSTRRSRPHAKAPVDSVRPLNTKELAPCQSALRQLASRPYRGRVFAISAVLGPRSFSYTIPS
jgi:hypothetical protein